MKAFLDLDINVYQVASACNGNHWNYRGQRYDSKIELNRQLKEDGLPKDHVGREEDPEDWEKVKKSLIAGIEETLKELDCQYQGYLTGKGNFRYNVARILPYKGNRSKDKPFHYDACRQFFVDNYDAIVSVGEEADDAIGIAATKEEGIVVSIDKDLDMIPGKHYNPNTGKHYEIGELEGMAKFYQQMLLGDPTDNILGLYGVGIKSDLLKNVREMESEEEMNEYVYSQYFSRFGNYAPEFYYEHAQLLWIRQYDKEPLAFLKGEECEY